MRQIAKGIAFLHIRDVVHRDIKPANILVKSTLDNNIIMKLGDFGLSKILDPNDETSSMSSDVGTLLFKAPEFLDKKPGDKVRYHRSVDVYAAGLTFTAMLQAKRGHHLVPQAEGSLLSSETRMPIGLAAFTRCQDKHSEIQVVRTDSNSDTPLVREVKMIIEKITYFSPGARISATELETRLNAFQGNERNALLHHSVSPQFQDVDGMPDLLAQFQDLDFAPNDLEEVEERKRTQFQDLEDFDFSPNDLEEVEERKRTHFQDLEDFDFSPNDLEEVEERKRTQFQDLEDFDFSPNDLEELEYNLTPHLTTDDFLDALE